MGKYIHKFETINKLDAAYNGYAYEQPWVSYTVENDQMNYDQLSKEYLLKASKPLCITTATSNKTEIYITFGSNAQYCYLYNGPLEIEYSLNNGSSWNKIEFSLENQEDFDEIDENTLGVSIYTTYQINKSILLRANFQSCGFYEYEIHSGIVIGATNPCYVSGNPCSLLRSENFNQFVGLPECAFAYLFSGGSWLLMDPEDPIMLPIKNISPGCYSHMFENCTNLEHAPELPATTIHSNCYSFMFNGCSSLITAFDLPAISLPSACYQNMFSNCTSLVNAPDIFATTNTCNASGPGACSSMFYNCSSLVNPPKFRMLDLSGSLTQNTPGESVYYGMFEGCTLLVTAPELPATILSTRCYKNMFKNCISLLNAPELPATTMKYSSYSEMFEGCTSLITAPELPATNLADYCYSRMFEGCTSLTTAPDLIATNLSYAYGSCYAEMFKNCSSLNYIKCLASNNINTSNFKDWTSGVSATGTFVQDPTVVWPIGVNGIPSGWRCNAFRIDTTSYTVDALNNTINLTGYCGYDNYTITSDSNWITVNSPNGTTGNINKNLTVTNNTGSNSRQGTVTVSVPNTDESISITINQQAPALTISQSKTTIGLNGGTIHISGRSTYSSNWSLTNNESWITDNISSYAPGNIDFDLTIAAGTSQRSATLYITCGGETRNITISQEQITSYYSVDLWDGDWIVDTGKFGPNGEVVYKSDYNYHQDSDEDEEDYAGMTITITGYNTFTIYVRTNGENSCDYLVVSQLDKIPTYSNNATYNKWHGKGKASASTWSEVTFINIPSGTHAIKLYYFKDDSDHSGEDRGFVYIPSTYNQQ